MIRTSNEKSQVYMYYASTTTNFFGIFLFDNRKETEGA